VDYNGKVVLITGASAGIGSALARAFARQGATLVLTARREDRLKALQAEIEGLGRSALAVAADVTQDGDLEKAVAAAVEKFGHLDVVVANAGFGVMGRVDRLGIQDYRRQMETNVFGVLRTIYAGLDELKRNRGQIVVIGSVSGHLPTPDSSAYCMSKFAVRGFCDSIYHDLARDGVGVTLVSPGFIATEIRRLDNAGVLKESAKDPVPSWLQMPAETAADQIVRAAAARKREIVLTAHGKLAVFAMQHFPSLVHFALSLGSRLQRPVS
jgi:short-subunit dehydrogenase